MPNGGGTERVSGLLQHAVELLKGIVLFAQSHDALSNRVAFGGVARALGRALKERSLRILAEFMAEDAEAAIAVAEAFGGFLGGDAIDEESAEGFVLAVRGIGRDAERAGGVCYLLSCII